jgi:hypothetical protein
MMPLLDDRGRPERARAGAIEEPHLRVARATLRQ